MQTTLNQISQSKNFDRIDAKWYWKLNTRTDSPYMYERTKINMKKEKQHTNIIKIVTKLNICNFLKILSLINFK